VHCARYPCRGTYKSPISGEIALTRRILSLDECLYKLATHDRSRRYAVLTFVDDGYRDNLPAFAQDRPKRPL
jgi:hypothetical protein